MEAQSGRTGPGAPAGAAPPGGAPQVEPGPALVVPLPTEDVQLLGELGIPVYPDGRVEAARVVRWFRERLLPALDQAKEQERLLQAEMEAQRQRVDRLFREHDDWLEYLADQVTERLSTQLDRLFIAGLDTLGDQMTQLGEHIEQQTSEQAAREASLVAAEQALASRLEGLIHQLDRLAVSYQQLGRPADHRPAEAASWAGPPGGLLVSGTLDLSRSPDQVSGEELAGSGREPAPAGSPAGPWAGERTAEVRFSGPGLLPNVRLRAKRSAVAALGADRVTDAANGRDLRVRGSSAGVEGLVRTLKESLAAYDVQVELRYVEA